MTGGTGFIGSRVIKRLRSRGGVLDAVAVGKQRVISSGGVVLARSVVAKDESPDPGIVGAIVGEKRIFSEDIEKFCEDAFTQWTPNNPEGFTREQYVGNAARKVVRKNLDLKPLVIVNFLTI